MTCTPNLTETHELGPSWQIVETKHSVTSFLRFTYTDFETQWLRYNIVQGCAFQNFSSIPYLSPTVIKT